MKVRTIQDTAIIGFTEMPDEVPPEAVKGPVVDLELAPEFKQKLFDVAILSAGTQGGSRACLMQSQDWTVTNDPERLAAWEPLCGCDECRDWRDQAVNRLRENPAGWIAFCDMEYILVGR